MSADVEDGFDQLLSNTWNQLAQQLTMLHRSLDADIAQASREHKARKRQAERDRVQELREMEAQRNRLLAWEAQHRREMNAGFENIITATVLGPDGCGKLTDENLLRAWNMSDLLIGTDPGFTPRNTQARDLMKKEWGLRHEGEDIAFVAGRAANRITIDYTTRSIALEDTVQAFEKAGMPVRLRHLEGEEAERFERGHPQQSFHVRPQAGDDWIGYDEARIRDCVTQVAVLSPTEAGDQIAFLRETGLPESSDSDNHAVGVEPSSMNESETSENIPAAPADVPSPSVEAAKTEDGERLSKRPGDLSTGETERLVSLDEAEELDAGDPLAAVDIETQLKQRDGMAAAAIPGVDASVLKEGTSKNAR